MSHTPLDESSAAGRDRPESADSSESSPESRGYLGRVVDAVRRLGSRVLEPIRRTDADPEPRTDDDRAAEATLTHPIQRSSRVGERDVPADRSVGSEAQSSEGLPVGRAGGPRERPDLVAEWGDGRLTLAEPGEADTHISSDTWTDVER